MKSLKMLAILGLTLAAMECPAHAAVYNTAEQNSMEHYLEINRQLNADVMPAYLETQKKLDAVALSGDLPLIAERQQDFWKNLSAYNLLKGQMDSLSDDVAKSLRARAMTLPHVRHFLARFKKQKPVIESVAMSLQPDLRHALPQLHNDIIVSGTFKSSKRRGVKDCNDRRELVHRSFDIVISAETGELVKSKSGTGFYPTTDCPAD